MRANTIVCWKATSCSSKQKDVVIVDGEQIYPEDMPGVWRLIDDMRANAQNVKIVFEALSISR